MKNRLVNLFGISSVTLFWTAVFVVAITALIALTTNTASAALSRIAYWQLDETSGTTFTNAESDSGIHDGSCTNCPTAVDGVVNGAQSFDGVDDAIDVPADSAFDWTGSDIFSVELWVQADDANVCNGSTEAFIGRGVSGSGQWSLGCTASGTVQFDLADDNGNNVSLQSTKTITDTAWHHVTATYDGSSDVTTLYVDGTDVISTTQAFSGSFAPTTADLNIGHLNGSAHFGGALDEIAVYDVLLSPTEIRTHYYLSRSYTATCSSDVRIMPLGDSITQGKSSGVPDEEPEKHISYRRDLWQRLADNYYTVDFVGSLQNGEYYDNFDPDHEGHPRWKDNEVAAEVFNWLTDNPADVLLLHIGTNELETSADDVVDILNEVDRYDPTITVVLARIINRVEHSNKTTTYNDNVEAMAEARIAAGDKIIVVDMEDGAGIIYDLETAGGDMYDNLHPYETGYTKMADVWYDALVEFMPTCLSAPEITSSPVETAVTGEVYTYTVTATGNPDPTFSLTTKPAGMEIDANTGEIQWTPDSAGPAEVTVEATNSEGSDPQTFTIQVSDPTPPSFTSNPNTTAYVNKIYRYDADADGQPAPTFNLTAAPPGMIVDASSGLVEWTPDSTGNYTVTLKAENSAGSEEQPYTISVATAPICPADTIAYWPLDDVAGDSTTYDLAGDHDATCTGAACPTVTAGQVENGLDFDGVDDGMDVTDDAMPDWTQDDSFSIELWVKTSQNCSGNKVFVGKYGSASWWLGCTTGGAAAFSLRSSSSEDSLPISGATNIADGAWHHIVAVRDGEADKNKLYVDGILESTQVKQYSNGFANDNDLSIGYYNNDFYFDGVLDEIGIYGRVLADSEIEGHYDEGLAGHSYCGDALIPYIVSDPVTEGVVGEAYSYQVETSGVPTPTFTLSGEPAGMEIGETTGLIQWTPDSSGTYTVTVSADNSAGSDSQQFSIEVMAPTPVEITSSPVTTASVGQPYNYNVTADGVPDPTFTLPIAPSGMGIDPETGLITWTPDAKGSFDVTVEANNGNDSDTQSFIIEVAGAPLCSADMTAYWKLDAVLSNTFTDTVSIHDATCDGGNCPTLVTGQVDNAAGFDGINDGLNVPDHDNFDWENGDSFAIELWMKTAPGQDCSGNKVFIGKYSSNDASWWVGCTDDGSGNGVTAFSLRDASGSTKLEINGTTPINDGAWHHVVAIRDGSSNENKIYVDGSEDASQPQTYNNSFGNGNQITLGYFDVSPYYRFEGTLDEVALYSAALSPTEITEHYNDGLNGKGYCETPEAPQITSSPVTSVIVNQPYSYDVEADGVPTPTYALVDNPGGMTVNNSSGLIEWTPTSSGAYAVSVTAGNSEGTVTQTYTITVADPPTITAIPDAQMEVGETFTYNVDATGYPAPTFSLTAAPGDMSIDPNTGVITWTPSTAGAVNVTVEATNAGGSDSTTFTISVGSSPVLTNLPVGVQRTRINEPFSFTVEATGSPAPTFELVSPPAGMEIDENTGEITWTPATMGSFTVTVEATNSKGSSLGTLTIEVEGYELFLPMITAAP